MIVLRGTAVSLVNPWDIWTDLNIGMQKGPSGWPVHAGFNDTFKSFADQLHKFLVRNNPTHVHCVGHSLGGALATLIADYLCQIRSAALSIYTFGCPRVGNAGFARNLAGRIKAKNIYRVYHSADPVSMIPIFPFFHAPNPGQDVPVDWGTSRIDGKAHRMENYTRSIGQSGWDGLMRRSDSMTISSRSIKSWLESTSTVGAFMYSARSLSMISRALNWIISRAAMITGVTITASFTALDQLAWLLHQGTLASKDFAGYLVSLIGKIFQFLGRPFVSVTNISVAFVRWVLDLLLSTVRSFAYRALTSIQF